MDLYEYDEDGNPKRVSKDETLKLIFLAVLAYGGFFIIMYLFNCSSFSAFEPNEYEESRFEQMDREEKEWVEEQIMEGVPSRYQ